MLEIKNLKKYFGGVKAVDNCSFKVEKNTITALIGPNGAGKSTVFNIISGVFKADSGNIFFKNKNITNLSPEIISNYGISRLFQQSRLFENLTIKENLLLALNNDDTKFWKNILDRYNFTNKDIDYIRENLKKIDMEKFENYSSRNLSFGQKRLVELARALIKPRSLLMLDEPVAGVTPKLREKISNILTDLRNKGETILIIEHDMNFTLSIADKIIVMDEGKVIAKGNAKEIKNNPKVLEAYLGD